MPNHVNLGVLYLFSFGLIFFVPIISLKIFHNPKIFSQSILIIWASTILQQVWRMRLKGNAYDIWNGLWAVLVPHKWIKSFAWQRNIFYICLCLLLEGGWNCFSCALELWFCRVSVEWISIQGLIKSYPFKEKVSYTPDI